MNYHTIAEIYQANTAVRERLSSIVMNLTEDQLNFRTDQNSWTIPEIVEHVSIVESGAAAICARLLQKAAAESAANDGRAHISDEFMTVIESIADRRKHKLTAPERVVPSGGMTIDESFAKMDVNAELIAQIRTGLETIDSRKHKFPHPYFGDLSAVEWFALIGGHELRHIDQIEEILAEQKMSKEAGILPANDEESE